MGIASKSDVIPVMVLKTPYFRNLKELVLTEVKSCYEWNPQNVRRIGPSTYVFINKQGVELWRIVFKTNELRVISSLKKVALRKGFCFNMVHNRMEVS